MKIYCLQNEYISVPVRYTINHFLNISGFFYTWLENLEGNQKDGIILYYAPLDLQLKSEKAVLHIPREYDLENLHQESWNWKEFTLDDYSVPILSRNLLAHLKNEKYLRLSFDIIANLYFHLARLEEINYRHPDEADGKVEDSILYKYQTFTVPVVDILIHYLSQQILLLGRANDIFFLRKALYPAGEEFSIALTHDVDFVRSCHPLKKGVLKLLIKSGLSKSQTIAQIEQADENYWGFDDLLKYYQKKKIKATFFFIARYMENLNFRYRIRSRKFKHLFSELKRHNHEIGFHPSRFAFEYPRRYANELKKLTSISSAKIIGMRHHYLRCLYPRIWTIAQKLDLKYDAGLIHRRFSGFRAGTCHPFPAFDHAMNSELNVFEFPTIFFENTLPEEGKNVRASKTMIQSLFETVKKYQGLLNILWHSNNINQPDHYAELWSFITQRLTTENALILTLGEHLAWLRQRDKIYLESYHRDNKSWLLKFKLAENLKQFSLLIPENYKFTSPEDLKLSIKDTYLVIQNPALLTTISLKATPN